LRATLRDLADAAASDPLRPQDVSRRFGINKNLTWKFARILIATDPFEAIPMIPGTEGIEIYLRAFESAGIASARTDPVREALRRFDSVVSRHFGDRAQLELVLDGLRDAGNLETPRRMAFKGMSVVFGLQARARVTAQIVTPNATDPGLADIALIVGLAGLQRLRPIGALPMFRAGGIGGAGKPQPEAFVCSEGSDQPDFLLREFCSYPKATVNAKPLKDGRFALELSEGPLGRVGASDLYFATVTRAALNLHRRAEDTSCSLLTAVNIPAESLVSDLFVHRSAGCFESMRSSIHSTLAQPLTDDPDQRRATMLPIDTTPLVVEDISSGFGVTGVARYEEMVFRAFSALACNAADYRLVRVAMEFPPTPSALLVEWDLPEPPVA
jgi:hypothetical protein